MANWWDRLPNTDVPIDRAPLAYCAEQYRRYESSARPDALESPATLTHVLQLLGDRSHHGRLNTLQEQVLGCVGSGALRGNSDRLVSEAVRYFGATAARVYCPRDYTYPEASARFRLEYRALEEILDQEKKSGQDRGWAGVAFFLRYIFGDRGGLPAEHADYVKLLEQRYKMEALLASAIVGLDAMMLAIERYVRNKGNDRLLVEAVPEFFRTLFFASRCVPAFGDRLFTPTDARVLMRYAHQETPPPG